MLGVDDKLMHEQSRSIPRADVAELCVQCLGVSEAQNRSSLLQAPFNYILSHSRLQQHYGPQSRMNSSRSTAQQFLKVSAILMGSANACMNVACVENLALEKQDLQPSFSVCRSVDVISRKPGQGTPTTDFDALFSKFQDNCAYESV